MTKKEKYMAMANAYDQAAESLQGCWTEDMKEYKIGLVISDKLRKKYFEYLDKADNEK